MPRSTILTFFIVVASLFNAFAWHKGSPYKGKGDVHDGHSKVPCKVLPADGSDSQLQFLYSHSFVRNESYDNFGFAGIVSTFFDMVATGVATQLDTANTKLQVSISQHNQEVFGFTQPFLADSPYASGWTTGQQMLLGKKMETFSAGASFGMDNYTLPSGEMKYWVPGWYDAELLVADTATAKKSACVRVEKAFRVDPKIIQGEITNLQRDLTWSNYQEVRTILTATTPKKSGYQFDPFQSFETVYMDAKVNQWGATFYPKETTTKPTNAMATLTRISAFTGYTGVGSLTASNDGCGMNMPIQVPVQFDNYYTASFVMPHCAGGLWNIEYVFPDQFHIFRRSFYAVERRVTTAGLSNIASKTSTTGTTTKQWTANGIVSLINNVFNSAGASPTVYIPTNDLAGIATLATTEALADVPLKAQYDAVTASATTQEIKDYIGFALHEISEKLAATPGSRRLEEQEMTAEVEVAASSEVQQEQQQPEEAHFKLQRNAALQSKQVQTESTIVATPNFCSTSLIESAFKVINGLGIQLEILNEQLPQIQGLLQAIVNAPTTPEERAYFNELAVRNYVYTAIIGAFTKTSTAYMSKLQTLQSTLGDCYTVAIWSYSQTSSAYTGICGQPFSTPLYVPVEKFVFENLIYAQRMANAAGFLFDEESNGMMVSKGASDLLSPTLQATWNTAALRTAMQTALFTGSVDHGTVTQIPYNNAVTFGANTVETNSVLTCNRTPNSPSYFTCACPTGSASAIYNVHVHLWYSMTTAGSVALETDLQITMASSCEFFFLVFLLLSSLHHFNFDFYFL
jgi:hypothetical protein